MNDQLFQVSRNKSRETEGLGFALFNRYMVKKCVVFKKTVWFRTTASCSLAGGVLGDSLGTLRDGVLGQLTGQEQPDSGLDLPRGDGAPLVVVSETAGLCGDALEDVVHERIHDGHGLRRDSGVRVDLFQHLVDVDGVRFLSPPLPLLVAGANGLSLAGFLGSLARHFGRHVDAFCTIP